MSQRQRSEGDQDQGLDDPACHEDPARQSRPGRMRSRNGIGEGDRDRQYGDAGERQERGERASDRPSGLRYAR